MLARIGSMRGLLRRERFGVVHCYGLRADLVARGAAKSAGSKVVTGIRGIDPWRRWYHTLLDRATQRHVDLWIANSRAGKLAMQNRQPIADAKMAVVLNGIEPPAPRNASRREATRRELAERAGIAYGDDLLVVVCVANLRAMKGHSALVAALPRLRRPRLLTVCAGADGPGYSPAFTSAQRELEATIAGGEFHPPFVFLGQVQDPGPYYEAADLATLPSEHEGLPASLIEGLSHGLPLVATTVGGIPEIICDGREGFLVPPRDAEALAEAMGRLIADSELRERMGSAGLARFHAEFALQSMIDRLNALYRGLRS